MDTISQLSTKKRVVGHPKKTVVALGYGFTTHVITMCFRDNSGISCVCVYNTVKATKQLLNRYKVLNKQPVDSNKHISLSYDKIYAAKNSPSLYTINYTKKVNK